MALPILLLVMALMLNYGTVASWKVRALTVARHSAWADRWPRRASLSPRPDYWPEQGTTNGAGSAGNIAELADFRVDKPVARGPLPYGTTVHSELLNPERGLVRGSASLARDFPLLRKLGQYHLNAQDYLLDDTWEFQRMGLPSNTWRRISTIYALAKADPAFAAAFSQAVDVILHASYRPDLRPLDDDEEFEYYTSTYLGRASTPNFGASRRLGSLCDTDRTAEQRQVDDLVDRIQGRVDRDAQGQVIRRVPGLAEDMAQRYVNFYTRMIQLLQNLLNANPPPANAGQIQAEISTLQSELQIVQQDLGTFQ